MVGEIAHIEPAIVRFSAPSAEGETKTDACAIAAALFSRANELVDIPLGSPPHSSWTSMSTRSALAPTPSVDARPRPLELEGVLQKVPTTAARTCLSADRAAGDLRARDLAEAERVPQSIQERGHSEHPTTVTTVHPIANKRPERVVLQL